jgi:hypothetical protein
MGQSGAHMEYILEEKRRRLSFDVSERDQVSHLCPTVVHTYIDHLNEKHMWHARYYVSMYVTEYL